MSKAIDNLEHEHEAILSSLIVLDNIGAKVESGSLPAMLDLDILIGFLKHFTDKCHHGKEEGLLFPALINAGMPANSGPIAVMLSEHAQGRNYIKAMEQGLKLGPDYKAFAGAAERYSSLLHNHIQKENSVLFPIAEKTLDKAQLEQLNQSFEEHEETMLGHDRHAELYQMLKELNAKYQK